MLNSISVDTEEYYHATNIEAIIKRPQWDKTPSRIEQSIDQVLQIFSDASTKATFFILGIIAEKHPSMVKRIAADGHEIGSHGYEHHLVYEQEPLSFLNDISKTKKLLEDTISAPVIGYRAPNFSIVPKCDWAYDQLIKAGYVYDSSVYPIRHPRYSNATKPRNAFEVVRETGRIFELPLAVANVSLLGREIRLPIAGGAYWRLFPLCYTMWGLGNIRTKDGMEFNCYFHPWELDSTQPRFEALSFLTKIRHYGGIGTFDKKLKKLLATFPFAPLKVVAKNIFGEKFPF